MTAMVSRQITTPPMWLAALLGLTLVLGASVVASWFLFGGAAAFRGPIRALADSWPLIYGSQAVAAGAVGFALARVDGRMTVMQLVALIGAAWASEWLVLLVGGRLIATELAPQFSLFYWLLATGGPIQPMAAVAGGVAAARWRPAT